MQTGQLALDRPWFYLVLAPALLLLVLLLSVIAGAADLGWVQMLETVWYQDPTHASRVILELRLPRVVLACLVGIHFSLAGFILQTLTRNPLADAGILGISAGASLMAVLTILLGGWFFYGADPYRQSSVALGYLPLFAMLGGVVAAITIYRLSGARQLTPLRLILTGVTFASILNALVTGSLALWGHAHTEIVIEWLAGSLYGRSWDHVLVLLPWSIVGLCCCVVLNRPLQLLRFQDEQSLTMGLDIERWRFIALLTATLLAASAVGVVGPVGFVGLLVPHICRRLIRGDLGLQLLLCAFLGGIIVMLGDLIGRLVLVPYELPVGVVSALLGVPFFLYLLHRQS